MASRAISLPTNRSPETDDIGIVVLAGKARGQIIGDDGSTNCRVSVCGNRNTDA